MLRSPSFAEATADGSSYAWRSHVLIEVKRSMPGAARRAKTGETCGRRSDQSKLEAIQNVHSVYIIKSESHPDRSYVGYSTDLKTRLYFHNQGDSPHTAKYTPWSLAFHAAFPSKMKALDFENYLKSHSGKAFTAKRLT